jgi:hypothetical protein
MGSILISPPQTGHITCYKPDNSFVTDTLSAGLATLGVFARRDLLAPPFQLLMLALLVASIGLGFRPLGRKLARQSSLAHLILLQAFRLPLEILMVRAAGQGIMPVEFSLAGYNFDVVTGASALGLGLALVLKWPVPRWVVVVWNLWGIACLVVIALLATLMSPNIAAFGDDPSKILSWVLYFPYSWLPHVLVNIAVLGHVLVTLTLREIDEP